MKEVRKSIRKHISGILSRRMSHLYTKENTEENLQGNLDCLGRLFKKAEIDKTQSMAFLNSVFEAGAVRLEDRYDRQEIIVGLNLDLGILESSLEKLFKSEEFPFAILKECSEGHEYPLLNPGKYCPEDGTKLRIRYDADKLSSYVSRIVKRATSSNPVVERVLKRREQCLEEGHKYTMVFSQLVHEPETLHLLTEETEYYGGEYWGYHPYYESRLRKYSFCERCLDKKFEDELAVSVVDTESKVFERDAYSLAYRRFYEIPQHISKFTKEQIETIRRRNILQQQGRFKSGKWYLNKELE